MSKRVSQIFATLFAVSLLVACGGGEEQTSPTPTAQSELSAAVKTAFGADPSKIDTDGDGLTDDFEIKYGYPFLKPNNKDTNGNGINDADEDNDVDGLTNLQEQQYKVNPLTADSDGDGLSDKDEIFTYKTDPNNSDTDGDGIPDGREVANGSNPLVKDADKVVTSSQTQTFISANGQVNNVTVQMTGVGDLANKVTITNYKNSVITNGFASRVYDFKLLDGVSTVDATITIPYDKTSSNAIDPSKLAVFTINPATGGFEELTGKVDSVNGTVSAKTTHFSDFVVADKNAFWSSLKSTPQTCDLFTDPNAKPTDIVLVIDSSGSMTGNDPSNIRKSAAKSFASKMKSTDRVSVVDFDNSARLAIGLSNNLSSINAAIDTIDSSGGTDIGAGVSIALTQLTSNSDNSKNRAIILLTDGDGSYNTSLTTQLATAGIRVFAIGLTGSVNTALLQGIATGTNGGYKQIQTADGLNNIFTEFSSVFGDTGKDTDGDGLTDCQETQGILVSKIGHPLFGKIIRTEPGIKDTDGDGIEDGVEIGAVYRLPLISTSATPWATTSIYADPKLKDSDSDNIEDADEKRHGTDPVNADTDGDGISDYNEIFVHDSSPRNRNTDGDNENDNIEILNGKDPTEFNNFTGLNWFSAKNGFFKVINFGVGAVCGDAICELENTTELAGAIVGGFVPIADVRDVLGYVVQGEVTNASVSFLGLVPAVGDIAKSSKMVAAFLKKFPQKTFAVGTLLDKMGKPGKVIKEGLQALGIYGTKSNFWDSMNPFVRGRHVEELNKAEIATKYKDTFPLYNNVKLIDAYKLDPNNAGKYIVRSDKSLDFFRKTYQEKNGFKKHLEELASDLINNKDAIRIPAATNANGITKAGFEMKPEYISGKELFLVFPEKLPSNLQKELDEVAKNFPNIIFTASIK
jgi:uncharacterized protein YegL